MKSDSIGNLVLRLVIITVAAGLILGLVYTVTLGPITAQEELKATSARQEVLPDAQEFEEVDFASINADPEKYAIIQKIFRGVSDGEPAGYTFEIVTKGYSAGLNLTVGMSEDGMVTGVAIGSNEETAGLGANAKKPEYTGQYAGKTAPFTVVKTAGEGSESAEVVALTGATITSNAVTDAVNTANEFFEEHLREGA